MLASRLVLRFHVPTDRRLAIADGETLPERCHGAALLADVSGFSTLSRELADTLGPRRAPEVLLERMNRVYETLIEVVESHAGSVIGFAGDSITCWFDDAFRRRPRDVSGARRALACGLAMQVALGKLASVSDGSSAISLKVAIAAGAARRFLVGDPDLLVLDALAGETLFRMARIEALARPGEVVVAEELATLAVVAERRSGPIDVASVVVRSARNDTHDAWPADRTEVDESLYASWVLAPLVPLIEARSVVADLRAVVPFFVAFGGIDYDGDEGASKELDALTRRVQHVIHRAGGSLLQLGIGDKGSSFYGVFGAPWRIPMPLVARRRRRSSSFMGWAPSEPPTFASAWHPGACLPASPARADAVATR